MEFLPNIPPAALFVVFVGTAVILAGICTNLRWGLVPVSLMIFSSSISHSTDPFTEEILSTLFSPIQDQRAFIFLGSGILCYVTILIHAGKFNKDTLTSTGVFLVAITFYGGLVRVLAGYVETGLISLALALFSIVPFVILLPNLLQKREQFYTLMRWIVGVMTVWLAMHAMQFVADPSVLAPGASGRFAGLTGNPQFVSVLFAFTITSGVWVGLNDRSKFVRLLALATVSGLGICLLWTASRTGFIMTFTGLSIILASRAKQLILLAPLIAIFGFVFLRFFSGDAVNIDVSRFVSTEDTRTAAFFYMIQVFLENPLFGVGDPQRAIGSENSYLLALASYGIFMGFIVFGFLITSMLLVLKLYRNRATEDNLGKAMTDYAIAGLAMYFLGGMAEGYFVARIHSALVYVAIAGIVAQRVLSTRDQRTNIQSAHQPTRDDGDGYEYADDEHPEENAYLPEALDQPEENVWEPEESWEDETDRERVY